MMCISIIMYQAKVMCAVFLSAVVLEIYGSHLVAGDSLQCPIWHIRIEKTCKCGVAAYDSIICNEVSHSISVLEGICMTWDDNIRRAVVNHCPLPHQLSSNVECPQNGYLSSIEIPINISGFELSSKTCKRYNRQGVRCRQCRDGYGPAVFSDSFSCADCSKYTHLWILNLFIQLIMVSIMYLAVILFQIKGAASPFNVFITYSQLFICPFTVSAGLRLKIICYLGPAMEMVALTVIGVWNLDFFRYVLPSVCVSSSLKSVNSLLFDYIIAFYPIVVTLFIYIGIELHDRNCGPITYLAIPIKRFFTLFRTYWNPRTTVLNTIVTFILLAYSKLFFTSINLLFAVRSYSSDNNVVPGSTVLLYDPSIRFFHSEHIPYAVVALSVIVIFVLLPPLLLLLYPTRLFRKCLNCCGFQRWDILHLIADIFQGWYKDGTEGTRDYRGLSALYLLLRVALGGIFLTTVYIIHHKYVWNIIGLFHVFLGTFFFIAKPYKKSWMNSVDGVIITLIGVLILINLHKSKAIYLSGIVCASLIFVVVVGVSVYRCVKGV